MVIEQCRTLWCEKAQPRPRMDSGSYKSHCTCNWSEGIDKFSFSDRGACFCLVWIGLFWTRRLLRGLVCCVNGDKGKWRICISHYFCAIKNSSLSLKVGLLFCDKLLMLFQYWTVKRNYYWVFVCQVALVKKLHSSVLSFSLSDRRGSNCSNWSNILWFIWAGINQSVYSTCCVFRSDLQLSGLCNNPPTDKVQWARWNYHISDQ